MPLPVADDRPSRLARLRAHPQRDLWLAFWSVPFFFSVFGLVFIPLSWMMPPRSPSSTSTQIDDFMQSPNLLIACVILVLTFGLGPVSNAVSSPSAPIRVIFPTPPRFNTANGPFSPS